MNKTKLNNIVNIQITGLKLEWETHLKCHGVKWINGQLGAALQILYENMPNYVHIDTLKKKVVEMGEVLTGTDPLQVRHLSTQYGWNIDKKGKYEHRLVSTTEPLPGFIKEKSWNT